MRPAQLLLSIILLPAAFLIELPLHAQDRVYAYPNKIILGRVTEVGPKQLKMVLTNCPGDSLFTIRLVNVDSIIYSNGSKDLLRAPAPKKNLKENIPQLNTLSFDIAGFGYSSLSLSYERRLKNGKVGLRVPLYIGYHGGTIAGEGLFSAKGRIDAPYQNQKTSDGISIATGLNLKFYLLRHRAVRPFIGPEAAIGYSRIYVPGQDFFDTRTPIRNGTVALLAQLGISINPTDRFNIIIDGGAGIGDMFGTSNAVGLTGLWHLGFSLGTNF